MKNLYCAALVALSLAVVVGCSGKPSGFPKTSSCEIVVVDGGALCVGRYDVALESDPRVMAAKAKSKKNEKDKYQYNNRIKY